MARKECKRISALDSYRKPALPGSYFAVLPYHTRQNAERLLWKWCKRWGTDLPSWRTAILVARARRLALLLGVVALVYSVGMPAQTLPPHGALVQQRLCADQANKFFRDLVCPSQCKKPIDSATASYVDHYDASSQICYVAVVRNTPVGKNLVYSTAVFDAFEGTSYANYNQSSENIKAGIEIKPPSWCSVEPRGHSQIICKSEDEFDGLIEKYFGLFVQ